MRKILIVLAALSGGAIALIVASVLVLDRAFPDAPRTEDADLRPSGAPVADEQNAYGDFVRLGEALKLSEEERALLAKQEESSAPNLSAVGPLVERGAQALPIFADFSRRQAFSDPAYRDLAAVDFNTPVPKFWPVVTGARLVSLRAEILARAGDAPQAMAETLSILDASGVLLGSEPTLIAALTGMMLQEMAARRARSIIHRGGLDAPTLRAAARRLAAASPGAAGLQSGLRYEYLIQARTLERLPQVAASSGDRTWYTAIGSRSRFLYQPERTKAIAAARFRPMIAEAAKPCSLARVAEPEPIPLGPGPNLVGRILSNIGSPSYAKIYARRCRSDQDVLKAAVEAASAAFRLERKRAPATLSELVPDYLDAVPADPFSGAELVNPRAVASRAAR